MTPTSVLSACDDAERASVLAALVEHDPSLRQRAEEFARRHLATVEIPAVADTVTDALLQLGTEDLANRAGPRRHGYVEPNEAAWQLLEQVLDPWIDDLNRRAQLGLHGAAVDLGNALLHALVCAEERAEQTNDCLLREWAPDFPAEATWQVRRAMDAIASATSAPANSPADSPADVHRLI